MKKLILVFLLFLSACSSKPQYYLYLYYAKVCPVCKSFIENVIPELKKEYGNQMKITQYDIDEESALENYARTCSLLKNYYADDNSGSIPFIVLDGYFAQVGYEIDDQEVILQTIRDAINGKDIFNNSEEIYIFEDGKTFR